MIDVPNPTIYLTDEEKRHLERKVDQDDPKDSFSLKIRELVQADMEGREVPADA